MDESRVVRTRRPPPTHEGPPYRFGSGYLLREGQVLTAAHVLIAADPAVPETALETVRAGDRCSIATWASLQAAEHDDAIHWEEGVVAAVDPESDVAVIAVPGVGSGLPSARLGVMVGSDAVAWSAVGFPNAGITDRGREAEQARGETDPITESFDQRLGLTVSSREASAPAANGSGWSGLSGAGIFAGECLIGVVTADPRGWERSLSGVRIVRALAHPEVGAALAGLAVEHLAPQADGNDADADEVRVVGDRVAAAVIKWRDRDELREWLRSMLIAGQPITCIYGRPGIGKSAVVAKVLTEFEHADPARSPMEDLDGLVYLSTRTGAIPLTAALVFERVAELASDSDAHELSLKWSNLDVQAFSSLWNALRRRRVVVVLDHLDDVQDAQTLQLTDERLVETLRSAVLAPSSPRIVTTSRERLSLPPDLLASVEMRELRDGLSSADGVALLRSFPDPNGSIGVESDDRLAQIVGLVEGVPHGLELVASNASNDRSFIGKLLAVTEAPEAILERLVSRNYENLDDPSHHIVGLLAMARVPLPESAVPELLAGMVDPELAVATLGRLIDARTIAYEPKPSPAPGIVRLHPLDADFVRQTLLEDERSLQKQLDGQLADWYRAQRTPPASWRSASDVGPNVREFEHRWRAARDPHERTAALAPLAEAAVQISRKGEGRQLLTAITRVEKEITDPLGLLYLDKCRFAVEFFNGSLKNAEEIARSAIGRTTDGEGAALRAEMRQSLGAVLRHRGRTRESSEVLQQLLDDRDDAVERSTLVLALLELGLSLCYLGEWDRARSVADTLESVAAEGDDAESRARVFDLRSLACLGDGDYAGAIAAATEGIAEYASTTSDDNIGYLQNVRGLARLYRGEVEAAVAEFTEGMSVAERYGQRRLEGFCALNLAWCALARASWPEAETLALRAADCLTMADTSDSSIAAHLLSALRDQSRDHTTLTTILGAAARMSRQNADVYNPGDEEVSRLAAALAAR